MTSTTGRRNSRRDCGFTLLELVLVMLIVSIIAAIAVPSLRNFTIGRKSANAMAELFALAQYGRTKAIQSGKVHRLNVDPSSREFWLTRQKDDATFEALNEDFGRHFSLPEGSHVQWEPPAVLSAATLSPPPPMPSTGAHNYIDFYPDGRIDAAPLRITDVDGQVRELGCRSETEPLALLDPVTK